MKTGFNLNKAKSLMEEQGVDCIISNSQENVYYTSDSPISTITSLKRLAAIFIPLDSEPAFAVHANEVVTAKKSTWIKDLRVYEGGEWESLKAIDFVANLVKEKELDGKKIAIELIELPGLWLDHLRKLLPNTEFVDSRLILDKMKSIKSAAELKLLSDANMATAKAITVAFEIARPGDTERDIALNMIRYALLYGGDDVAFMTLGAGENHLETHHIPNDYKIKNGDLIHVDFGCYFDRYYSDISRMAVVGEPNEDQIKSYDVVVGAERITGEAMHADAKVIDVHNAVKEFYESKGYEYDRPFVGHSIGIGCHEIPFLGPSDGDWTLEPGMFFQVEPSMRIGNARTHTEDSFVVMTQGPAKNVSLYRDVTELQVIR